MSGFVWVRKLKSEPGPGQVYLMIFGETPQLLSHHEDCAHSENIWNKLFIFDIRTLALNWVGFLMSGFAHL